MNDSDVDNMHLLQIMAEVFIPVPALLGFPWSREVVSSSSMESNHRIIIYRDGERSARTGSKRSISSPICSE